MARLAQAAKRHLLLLDLVEIIRFARRVAALLWSRSPMRLLLFCCLLISLSSELTQAGPADRLTVLEDTANIYYPNQDFPKLTTPQWIGEEGVDAALILAIDDMRDIRKYENYIRPILERLKQIDGRAPLSIMSCNVDPKDPQLQDWLKEGVSIEAHTIDHPCPILAKSNFDAAKSTYDRCVDLFNTVPNSRPVAFRTPCMDGINSASPRLFAEILNGASPNGNFLTMGSSVGMLLTWDDPENPRDLVTDAKGAPRFEKYILPGWINYIKNYPYPYTVGNRFWEVGFCLPDDYEASRVAGDRAPQTVADMQASIDVVVAKKGLWVLTFHPYQWITNTQVVKLVGDTVSKHGKKVKFLNFREAQERIDKNLLAGQSLRRRDGSDNGVRLLDVNNDGYLDVVIGNDSVRKTRIWLPKENRWMESDFPTPITSAGANGTRNEGVRFGVLQKSGYPSVLVSNESSSGLWHFDGKNWVQIANGTSGLHIENEKVLSSRDGRDNGVRFRDVDGDGISELIVSNPKQNAIFSWNEAQKSWQEIGYGLPKGASIVSEEGRDNGVRFVDFNSDGHDDVIFSNEKGYGLSLFVPKDFLGFKRGYTREIIRGARGDKPEIPMITRGGAHPDNGAFFTFASMFVQNEDTDKLTNLVERLSFKELLDGLHPQAKSPQESLGAIETASDLQVDLVAHEPAVESPVYLDWSADGSMWVVEMRDYPRGVNGKAAGVVKRLEDLDGDGFCEKSTAFLTNLNYPNGLVPWRNGVLISAAPDIIYAEDTDGDGRADRTEVLFSGFREGNQQHRANGYELGLDGWFYGANGDSGGEITSTKTGRKVSISGRDFRFKPDTGEFEAISGNAQFGRRHDDFGNWFGGANYTWGWHYYVEERYLSRNANLAVRGTYQQYAAGPDDGRVFPISRVQQRFNDIGMAGHVTSACSFAPYRDDLFGGDFRHSIFISEPTHNLVHREVLEADGVSFKGHRGVGEDAREFMASRDPWFRPTTIKTGPDGAIYVCDMYRLVIEHPEWIPQDVQARMNLRAGEGMGRIYRIHPKGKPLRKIPNLSKLAANELPQALESSNGWQRDTVERLLVERNDRTAVPVLQKLAIQSSNPKVRVQALYCMQLLGAMNPPQLIRALDDSDAHVREHALRLSEPFLAAAGNASLLEKALTLTDDPDMRVRYQLAFTLGESKDARVPETLARIAIKDSEQSPFAIAVASSSAKTAGEVVSHILDRKPANPGRAVPELLKIAAKTGDKEGLNRIAGRLLEPDNLNDLSPWKIDALSTLMNSVKTDSAEWQRAFERARQLASNRDASESERVAALQLVAHRPDKLGPDAAVLAHLLGASEPLAIQRAALRRLEQIKDPQVAAVLLGSWRDAAPQTRAGIATLLLRREPWTKVLLDAVAKGTITQEDLGPTIRQQLATHPSAEVRDRAEKLFAGVSSAREPIVRDYLEKVRNLKGSAAHGQQLFEANCAICHTAGHLGTGAGPNLAMLYDRGPEQILTAILDPNRAVEDKYRNYVAELKNGEQISGLLARESGNSVTIVGINGIEQPIMRSELKKLEVQNRSLMPEGFEQVLKPQDCADLISFIQSSAGQGKN